jgi:anti-sigma B factor antagonist
MAHFEARTTADPGRVVVSLTGECDLEGRDELTAVLLNAVDGAPVVLVDLAGVTFIDSAGINSLLKSRRLADERERRFRIANATGVVRDVLDLTGVLGHLSG